MTLAERILQSLGQQPDGVLLRKDIAGLGSSSGINAALRSLQERGLLQRVGAGAYARPRTSPASGDRQLSEHFPTPTSRYVFDLVRRSGVHYAKTYADQWAESVTSLAGDAVKPDATEDALVALKRSGNISGPEMVRLAVTHLREKKGV